MDAVTTIKAEIKTLAQANGYQFVEYRTNHTGFAQDVGYAVIPANIERPAFYNHSRNPKNSAAPVAVAYARVAGSGEGTTEKCVAYKRLARVLSELKAHLGM